MKSKLVKNCVCHDSDFEWYALSRSISSISDISPRSEFNHQRNEDGVCALVKGARPLPHDDTCPGSQDYWYERTAYRKIPYSTCEDGERPDRGTRHACPGLAGHGFWFWLFVLVVPFAFTSLIAYGYYRRSGMARGYVHYLVCRYIH